MYNIPKIYPPQEDSFLSITQRLSKKTIYRWTIEAISKIGFWFKVKAGPRFNPQAYSSIQWS
jgi:hypothetical protein